MSQSDVSILRGLSTPAQPIDCRELGDFVIQSVEYPYPTLAYSCRPNLLLIHSATTLNGVIMRLYYVECRQSCCVMGSRLYRR